MSTSIRDGKPYALDVTHNLNGANGFTFAKSIGEKIDDSFDAGSPPCFKTIHTSEMDHLMIWNYGENLTNLANMLGLSEVIAKKPESKIGLKNSGSFAAIYHLAPNKLTLMSRNTEGKIIELVFRIGEYLELIKQCQDDNYNDPRLLPNNFIESSKITEDTKLYIKNLIRYVKEKELNNGLENIFLTSQSFVLLAFDFDKRHKYYNNLDTEMGKCFDSFALYHSKIITERNSEIIYESSEDKLRKITKKKAVDLMNGNDYLSANIEVRSNDTHTVLKVSLGLVTKIPSTDTFEFYISDKTHGTFKNSAPYEKYPDWVNMSRKGSFTLKMTQLSQNDDKNQKKLVGDDFSHTQDLRGIYISYNGRYLGKPYWPDSSSKLGWPAKQNMGPLRVDVSITNSHFIAEKLFHVQSDKSVIDLLEAHPVIIRLLDMIVGNTEKQLLQSTKKTAAQKDNDD